MDSKDVERPVLYLSKALAEAEKNYQATELETAMLVQFLQKLQAYLNSNKIKVVTDHSAIHDAWKDEGDVWSKQLS